MKKISMIALLVSAALTGCQPPEADKPNTPTDSKAADGEVNVVVTDKACEPMEITVPSGQTVFNIQNNSGRKLEWEILQGVMVVDERENIAPGLSSKLTATLLPGEYQMTCGLLSNPRGTLKVTDSGFKPTESEADMMKLKQPLEDYKVFVQEEMKQLVSKTEQFVEAVKAGNVEKAKSLFASTRYHYEKIEPIADLFADYDDAIDAREDDFKDGIKDPDFTGFHRIEYALWIDKNTKGMNEIADKLLEDVKGLQKEIDLLAFPPTKVVGGAADLIEEVASKKISGEEDRYSHTDLSDFKANIEGAEKIIELFGPMIAEKNKALLDKVQVNIDAVNKILAKYQTENGFKSYDNLSDSDRNQLKAPINTLAEDLAQFRGILGLD